MPTRSELHTMLLLWPLPEVLDRVGVDWRRFVGTKEDPWGLADYTAEVEWCERHFRYDDECEVVRVL